MISIDVFNSRAPVWMASDLGRELTGTYVMNFLPVGGMCCCDGMVVADHLPGVDGYKPLQKLAHANSNVRFGIAVCGPRVGRIDSD